MPSAATSRPPQRNHGISTLGSRQSGQSVFRSDLATPSLQGLASANLSGHYALGSNIEATATQSWNLNAGFKTIGTVGVPFRSGTAVSPRVDVGQFERTLCPRQQHRRHRNAIMESQRWVQANRDSRCSV